jgi:hypothetical protein
MDLEFLVNGIPRDIAQQLSCLTNATVLRSIAVACASLAVKACPFSEPSLRFAVDRATHSLSNVLPKTEMESAFAELEPIEATQLQRLSQIRKLLQKDTQRSGDLLQATLVYGAIVSVCGSVHPNPPIAPALAIRGLEIVFRAQAAIETRAILQTWADELVVIQTPLERGLRHVITQERLLARGWLEALIQQLDPMSQRMFACKCAKLVLEAGRHTHPHSLHAILVSEDYARGKVAPADLSAAREAAQEALEDAWELRKNPSRLLSSVQPDDLETVTNSAIYAAEAALACTSPFSEEAVRNTVWVAILTLEGTIEASKMRSLHITVEDVIRRCTDLAPPAPAEDDGKRGTPT